MVKELATVLFTIPHLRKKNNRAVHVRDMLSQM